MTPSELGISGEILEIDPSLATQTPLWFYILREAEVRHPGDTQLGEVGGFVVAETILGALHVGGVDVTPAVGATADDSIPAAPTPATVGGTTGLLRLLCEI